MKSSITAVGFAIVALVFLGVPSYALDQAIFAKIGPTLSYDPATNQSRPFYPIGWYYCGPVTSLATMEAMAGSGSNTVVLTDVGASPEWHYGLVQQDLDWAQQLGMKVVVGILRDHLGVDKNNPASYVQLNWVHRFKNHPALLGWQLGDEEVGNPDPARIRAVQDAAYLLKQWDPHHQIWQVAATGNPDDRIVSYMNGTDIYSLDFYQYFDTTAPFGGANSLLTAYTHHAELAGNNGWGGNINVTQGIGADKGALSEYRFPSTAEYRWNVFSHLASAGARGTVNWIYDSGPHYYSNPELFAQFRDQTAKPVMMELRKLQHALETGWNVGTMSITWTSKSADDLPGAWTSKFNRVSQILLYDDSTHKYFVVVTNNGSSAQDVSLTISSLPKSLRDLSVAASTGGASESTLNLVDLGKGSYRLDTRLDGYGVGIYEFNAIAVP